MKKKPNKIKDILEFLEDFKNEKEQLPNNDEIEEEEYLEEIHKINENDFNIEKQDYLVNKNYTSESNENSNEENESDENSYIDNTKVQLGNKNYKKSNTKSNRRTEKNGEKRRSKSSALFLKSNYMKKLDINNIEDNKFDNAPSKYFNVKLAKKIDTKQISSQNDNTLSNFKNIYSLKWLGKNFFRMTKKKI